MPAMPIFLTAHLATRSCFPEHKEQEPGLVFRLPNAPFWGQEIEAGKNSC